MPSHGHRQREGTVSCSNMLSLPSFLSLLYDGCLARLESNIHNSTAGAGLNWKGTTRQQYWSTCWGPWWAWSATALCRISPWSFHWSEPCTDQSRVELLQGRAFQADSHEIVSGDVEAASGWIFIALWAEKPCSHWARDMGSICTNL